MILLIAKAAFASASVLPFAVAAADNDSCAQWGSPRPNQSVGRRTTSVSGASYGINRMVTFDIWYPAIDNGEEITTYLSFLPDFLRTMNGNYGALDNPVVASPSSNSTDGFQLLVYSHGHGGMRQQSASLMEHLASFGFVVAAPDHIGGLNGNGGWDGTWDGPTAIWDRVKIVSLVIDTMLSTPLVEEFHLRGNVDGGVGVLGMSLGAHTSLMAAADDGRVRAVLPLAPVKCFQERDCDNLSNVTVPTLAIGAANDTSNFVVPNNAQAFGKTNGFPRWNLVVRDTDHISFTDMCIMFNTLVSFLGEDITYTLVGQLVCGGDIERCKLQIAQAHCESGDQTHALVRYYATAFFRTMLLLGDDDGKGRDSAMKCMAERANDFDLLQRFEILKEVQGSEVEVKEAKEDDKEEEAEAEEAEQAEGVEEAEEAEAEEAEEAEAEETEETEEEEAEEAEEAETEEAEPEEDGEGKEDKEEKREGEEDEDKDSMKESRDVTVSKSELASRSSAEEEYEEYGEDEEREGEGVEEDEDEDDKEEEEGEEEDGGKEGGGEKEEGAAEEDKDGIKGSLDVTNNKSERAPMSSAKEEVKEDKEGGKEDKEEEGNGKGDKAEEDKVGIRGSIDVAVTDSKSEVASKLSAEEEQQEEDEEDEEVTAKGEEKEEDKAENDKDDVKGSPDVTDNKREVAFASKSSAATLSIDLTAVVQLLMFCVVYRVWYQ